MTKKRKVGRGLLQGIAIPIAIKNRKMLGVQDARVGLLAMRKMQNPARAKIPFSFAEKKREGIIDRLLDMFSVESTEKRVGLLQKVLTMLDSFGMLDKNQQKKFKRASVRKTGKTIWLSLRG